MKAFVSTYPFCVYSQRPKELFAENNIEYVINPLGRKMTSDELKEHYSGEEVIIAGTEMIPREIISSGSLKQISRVGIGLDSVDLNTCDEEGIEVCYTPDAPSPAVAELTVGLMFDALRRISMANNAAKNGNWDRYFGRRLTKVKIGIIGCGRIGSKVIDMLHSMGVAELFYSDINPSANAVHGEKTSSESIIRNCDVVSIHIPLNDKNRNFISEKELKNMKRDAILINTSRGGVVHEKELYKHLKENKQFVCASDVFETEPYAGNLCELNNTVITGHMGSMTIDCRTQMEIEAVLNSVNFMKGLSRSVVPVSEYESQQNG